MRRHERRQLSSLPPNYYVWIVDDFNSSTFKTKSRLSTGLGSEFAIHRSLASVLSILPLAEARVAKSMKRCKLMSQLGTIPGGRAERSTGAGVKCMIRTILVFAFLIPSTILLAGDAVRGLQVGITIVAKSNPSAINGTPTNAATRTTVRVIRRTERASATDIAGSAALATATKLSDTPPPSTRSLSESASR